VVEFGVEALSSSDGLTKLGGVFLSNLMALAELRCETLSNSNRLSRI